MSANFSLALLNPAVKTGPSSVVYTGLTGGNTLDLALGNAFGFDLQIGGASSGQYLVVRIAAGVMDAAGAAALQAGSITLAAILTTRY